MSDVYVDASAIIDNGVIIGKGTKVWHFVHIMEDAQIGKGCVIADYVYVGKGVKIGNKVKLENRTTVYMGVTIEDNVFVGPHVAFTNDPYPRSFNKEWEIRSTHVKEGSSIGAGAIIVCGITIGKYALVGAGSIVTENIPDNALVYGNPARIKGFVCKCGKKLKIKIRNDDCFLMKCTACEEQYEIAIEDYVKIEKER
jgi:acetyltransferase-like isoleucine patch superfamily enzyme